VETGSWRENYKLDTARGQAERIEFNDNKSMDKSGNNKSNRLGNSRMLMLVDLVQILPAYSDTNSFRKEKLLFKIRRKGQRR
jgi:hypothetical protein